MENQNQTSGQLIELTPQQVIILSWIVRIIKYIFAWPVFMMPKKLEGYRRVAIAALIGLLTTLQAVDWFSTTNAICSVLIAFFAVFGKTLVCSPEMIAGVIGIWITTIFEAAKEKGKPSIFDWFGTLFTKADAIKEQKKLSSGK